jgi:hypothetical protein
LFGAPFGRCLEFTLAAILSAFACPAPAQEAKPEPPPATFRADTALVMLDLVVRDKKGAPVRDLRPDEVQVFEDGVRREVSAFKLVETNATADTPAATAALPNPTRLLSLTTLVFESLDGTTAPLARKAALQFLDRALGERSRVAVVHLGPGLSLVQPYTSNSEHLRRAVEMVTNAAGPDTDRFGANSPYWRDMGHPWGGMHSTTMDLAILLQTFLNGGVYNGRRVFSKATTAAMTRNQNTALPNRGWGFGWGLATSPVWSYFGELASPRTFGHSGATGTVAWADPETGLVCVILTTRPSGEDNGGLLRRVSNAVAAAVQE